MAKDEQSGLLSKEEANYRVGQEELCGSCTNFIAPDHCKVVAGTISPKGASDLYAGQDEKQITGNLPPVDLDSFMFGGSPSVE